MAERAAGRGRDNSPSAWAAARFRATTGLPWKNSKLDPLSGFAAFGRRGNLRVLPRSGTPALFESAKKRLTSRWPTLLVTQFR